MLGVSIVTVVYIAVSVVFLYLVPPDRIAADETAFAALAGEALFGRAGEVVFSAHRVVSVAGSLAAVLMAFPRVLRHGARRVVLSRALRRSIPRTGAPARAIAIQAVLAPGIGTDRHVRPDPLLFHGPDPGFPGLDRRRGLRRFAAVPAGRARTTHTRLSGLSLAVPGPVLIVIVLRIVRDPLRAAIGLSVRLAGCARLRLGAGRAASNWRERRCPQPIPPIAIFV